MSSPFAGLILAGGLGKRWGGPKAWAKMPDGNTFLEACATTLMRAGADPVMATLPPGIDGSTPSGVEGIRLPSTGLDMFTSMRQGLTALASTVWSCVIVLPVDHPLVTAATVRALADTDAQAAISTLNGRHGHPLCLSRAVADHIVDGSWPGPTLREVLKQADAVDVSVDDPGIRANCNTPEVLADALAGLSAAGEGHV